MDSIRFYDWLMGQTDRDDPVGNLARDVRSDGNEVMASYGSRNSWQLYLASWASGDARRALDGAMDEFDDSRGKGEALPNKRCV